MKMRRGDTIWSDAFKWAKAVSDTEILAACGDKFSLEEFEEDMYTLRRVFERINSLEEDLESKVKGMLEHFDETYFILEQLIAEGYIVLPERD